MNPAKLLTSYRHTAIALIGVLTQVVALGVLSGRALHVTQIVLVVLQATATATVSNVPDKPKIAGDAGFATPPLLTVLLVILAALAILWLLGVHFHVN